MKRETINTFSDGLSLDLNPLGTPAKTLTNCLNGTLITYNGNELTLQNDMGNVPVGTAQLPHGYVPVGIKEHGGIIYVASYNPETGKGQLGCFPSPLLIYTSEAALTILDLNILHEFIEFINGVPFIKINELKTEIFKDAITLEAKVFNSGDLFIIKTETNLSEELRKAIDENIISLNLYIVPTSGADPILITGCEDSNIKTYDDLTSHKSLWIFLNEGNMYEGIKEQLPFDILIQEYPEYLQSYPKNVGPGVLQIVIELNTFKLFNLYNSISKTSSEYKVLFIGQAEADDTDLCFPVSDRSLVPLNLAGNINYTGHTLKEYFTLLTLNENTRKLEVATNVKSIRPNLTLYYDILPASIWGVSDMSFLKSGKLSYKDISDYEGKIKDWEFEINTNEVILKWSFIYLNTNKKIDHMRFVCIPLDKVLDNNGNGLPKSTLDNMYITGNTTNDSQFIYKIKKPYFSGNFEDTFPIDLLHLSSNYIYLCRLDIVFADGTVTNAVDYRLLYTGTFFNDKDISQFNYDNRPLVQLELETEVKSDQTLKSKNYLLLKEETSGIITDQKNEIIPSDVMLLADDSNVGKLIGAVENDEYSISSVLTFQQVDNALYNGEKYNIKRSFAGNIVEENLFDAFASLNTITFLTESSTDYKYNEEGDELIESCKRQYIEEEKLNGISLKNNPTILFTKDSSGKYTNVSTAEVNRGIMSRFGTAEEKAVVHQGLYPVYEEEDALYNSLLFGFLFHDEDDSIDNCVLCKVDSINNYIYDIISNDTTTDSDGDRVKYPYSKNATVQGNTKLVNKTEDFSEDSILKVLKDMGNKPINILVTTEELNFNDMYTTLWGCGLFAHKLTMPHEISFNEETNAGHIWTGTTSKMSEHSKNFKTNNLHLNVWQTNNFCTPHTTSNCMTITWTTQYGPRMINIATPLDIAVEGLDDYLITLEKEATALHFRVKSRTSKYSFASMHLRAEKLLFCMLSQILIAKCKNDTLFLNIPDVLYKTELFNNYYKLNLNSEKNISLVLNGVEIEKALLSVISNNTLNKKDVFIPNFKAKLLGLTIKVKDSTQMSSLHELFSGVDVPYFSSLKEGLMENIYPGKIEKVDKQYLCRLEKDNAGVYKINDSIIRNGKFYNIFLPSLITETNQDGKEFSCKNTATYKFILEGYAYNDILLPTTRIMKDLGNPITKLNPEESDNPSYNLLYYNAITDLKENLSAITLFGDQSAVINTQNFNPSSGYPAPVLGTNLWKSVSIVNITQ